MVEASSIEESIRAGMPVTHSCSDCGTQDKLYEKGRCSRCSLRRRARELLSAGTSHVPPEMAEVFEAITAARQPRSALNWLRKGAGAGLLADVAAGRLAISHQALDDCPHRRAADYLRHILTAAGTLPQAFATLPKQPLEIRRVDHQPARRGADLRWEGRRRRPG